MEDLKTVKQRIKKLLALSKSCNENEAASALRKANELMADYNFTAVQFSEYTEEKVKGTKRFVRWRDYVQIKIFHQKSLIRFWKILIC